MKQTSHTLPLTIATVFANLINKATFELSDESILVFEALTRANPALKEMSISEVGNYLSGMSDEAIKGLANNVKGIYHELLYVKNENSDGDDIIARLFPDTNHPGADVILSNGGGDFSEIQLKATDSIAYIKEHYVRYPDTPILVTSEVSGKITGIESTGILNSDLEASLNETFSEIEEQGTFSQVEDAAGFSALMTAVAHAESVLSGKVAPQKASLEALKDVSVAVSATALVDILFS